jgi:hypothetical protein
MADASNKVSTTTQITHIGSGTSLASGGTINPSSDVSTALSFTGNLARYPRCDAALMITATASIASTSTNVYLYRRDIDIDGTSDETAPGSSNKQKFMGAFQVQAATTVSTTHYSQITDVPLPGSGDCEFYIENALGVNIPAGWTLKITPKTDVGATA